MKLILLITFLIALVIAKECTLDASSTEWRLSYGGMTRNANGTTTFTYRINTISDRSQCGSKPCQSLSHWVLETPCSLAPLTSPASSCGKDGQYTIDGQAVVGTKWDETRESVGRTLTYTVTVSGCVSEGSVRYSVKGSTRCGYGQTTGPVACTSAPECRTNSDCDDGIPCTVDTCLANGVCSREASASFCDDGFACTSEQCSPGAVGADSRGCVVQTRNSQCNDGFSCTSDVCDPSDSRRDVNGCVFTTQDSQCDDFFSCTSNVCNPRDTNADASSGCVFTPQVSVCRDAYDCTEDSCNPALSSDSTGCVNAPIDDVCQDQYSCTSNACVPSASGSDSRGCLVTYNDNVCEDGFSCSDNYCDPSNAGSDVRGCRAEYFNERCSDSIACTDDTCTVDGCKQVENDSNCGDSNICTDDVCSIASRGCLNPANSKPCDDADACTGTLASPDVCADKQCQSGALVCPFHTQSVFGGQYYYGGQVIITNDAENFYLRWDASATSYVASDFAIYIGLTAPSSASPGLFPFKFTLSTLVSKAQFKIPFPLNVGCATSVFVAFHVNLKLPAGAVACGVAPNQNKCSSEAQTGWMYGKYYDKNWHQWGWYDSLSTCCCSGFSHLALYHDTSALQLTFVSSTKAISTNAEDELAQAIAEILNIPVSAVQVLSYDQRDDSLEDAVVRFEAVNGMSPGTLVRQLSQVPSETFEQYGFDLVGLSVIPDQEDDIQIQGDLYDFSSDESSNAAMLTFGALLFVLVVLF